MRKAQIVRELKAAIIFTQEYTQLPALEGWSWYDALVKHAPADAARLRRDWLRHNANEPVDPPEEG